MAQPSGEVGILYLLLIVLLLLIQLLLLLLLQGPGQRCRKPGHPEHGGRRPGGPGKNWRGGGGGGGGGGAGASGRDQEVVRPAGGRGSVRGGARGEDGGTHGGGEAAPGGLLRGNLQKVNELSQVQRDDLTFFEFINSVCVSFREAEARNREVTVASLEDDSLDSHLTVLPPSEISRYQISPETRLKNINFFKLNFKFFSTISTLQILSFLFVHLKFVFLMFSLFFISFLKLLF